MLQRQETNEASHLAGMVQFFNLMLLSCNVKSCWWNNPEK